ncbi:MAG: sugar phosphate isomerase/epimerase [Thermoguttaceae bacterium]|jgi:sugar phosphate isomerase/epimerase|nr:sugar phosphate isomerase/epimerase [Thermoguttaceae bacterium]
MQDNNVLLSRRSFLGGASAFAASAMLPGKLSAAPATAPNSKFNGVQIGVTTYSYRSMPGSAENLLEYIMQCGVNSVELMFGPAEQFARAATGGGMPLGEWRGSPAAAEGYKALRTLYNDAGVNIHLILAGNIGNADMPDEQIEYYFQAAKTLGAGGITREISEPAAERLGPIADRHQIMVGFHNHTQITPTTYDGPILSHGKYLGINLDIGHYVAGTNESPVPLIEKHKDRITNLHLKDRKKNNGPNMPFGQGDTPIGAVLQYMREHGLTFPADIELEYPIPEGSDAVREVTRCVEFCRDVLA